MAEQQRQLPLIRSKTDRSSVLLTAQSYEELIASPALQQLCLQISQCDDEARQQQLKAQLPAVQWMAQWPADGHRPKKDDATASGLCFHDFDHLEASPQQVYEQQVKPQIEALGIGLVKTSARGHGLHVVSLIPEGWTPEQTQIWVAEQCGLSQYRDRVVTDLSRLAFCSCKEMHLYYDAERLWSGVAPVLPVPPPQPSAAIRPSALAHQNPTQATPPDGVPGATATVIPTMYDDTCPYDLLVPCIIDHLGGVPRSFGGRHEAFKRFAFALATVMDFCPDIVMHYLRPYQQQVDTMGTHPFGEEELLELVRYACQKRTFSQSRDVRQALVEARAKAAALVAEKENGTAEVKATIAEDHEEDEEVDFLERYTHRPVKLPKKLPSMLATLVSGVPDYYREAMALSAMPALMTLADGVTYDDLMGNERFLSSHVVLVGPPSTNKGKIVRQTELLLKRLMDRDEAELQKVEDNKKEIREAERSGQVVHEYEPQVRILPPATSVNEYLRLQKRAGNQTLFMYTPEISNMSLACSAGSWSDLRSCFREGYDGDYHGQLRSASNSFSGRVRLRLNVLSIGTPGQAFGYREVNGRWKSGFYESKENGLASRLLIVFMPTVVAEGLVRFKPLTTQQLSEVEKMTLQLEAETGHLYAKHLHKTMVSWQEEMCKITLKVGGGLIDEGRRRAAVQGLACGYVAYLIEGRKDSKVVSDWARYVADLSLHNYLLSYARQEANGAALMPNAYHTAPIQDLLAAMPDEFTIKMLVDKRLEQGKSANVRTLLGRLVNEGLLEKVGSKSGIYRKIKQGP